MASGPSTGALRKRLTRAYDFVLSAGRSQALHPLGTAEIGLGGDRAAVGWLFACLIAGFALRQAAAMLFPSAYFPDETFQYWEQGYRMVFGYGIVPWEYRVGLRTWIVPGAIGSVIWFVDALGGGPAVWRAAVQALLSLASLGIIATAFLWARRLSGTGAAVLAAFVATIWFEFIYFSAKPFTEIIAAAALFPAAYLLCAVPAPTRRVLVSGGALLGLGFVLRLHLAPAILVIALAALHHLKWPRVIWPAATATLVVLLAGLLDWLTWGAPFHSFWQNFSINLLEGKAASFGTQPIFWYLLFYANAWPGFVAVGLALMLLGARRAPLLFVVPLVILVSHSLIGHKEYRFLYPGLPFLMVLASIGSAELFAFAARNLAMPARRWGFAALAFGWLMTSASLGLNDGFRPYFVKRAEQIRLFETAGGVPELCGIGISGMSWWDLPGYSGLYHNVPIYPVAQEEAAGQSQGFNLYVYRRDFYPGPPDSYADLQCLGSYCLAQRAGTCTPLVGQSVVERLASEE